MVRYCEILLNDDMIYKTRTKQYTTMPFFVSFQVSPSLGYLK
jgi:hypothetical protein